MRKAIRGVRLWLGSDAPLRETEKILDDTYRESHVEQLRTRLHALGARIIDHPPVSHARLMHALRVRRKPFADDRGGYQDALVWYTVVGLAKEHPEVVLITQNHSHFPTDTNGRPDPGLLFWLDEDMVPVDRVRVYHSAEAFSAAVILPTHPLVPEKAQILAGKHPTIDLQAAIRNNAARILLAAAANVPDISLPTSLSDRADLKLDELKLDIKEVADLLDEGVRVVVACTFSTNISALRESDGKPGVLDSWMRTLDRWLGDTLIASAELSFVFDRHDGRVSTLDVGEATVEREGRGQIPGSKVTWRLGPKEPGEPVAPLTRPSGPSPQEDSTSPGLSVHMEVPALPPEPEPVKAGANLPVSPVE
jgi:PIN domain